MDFHNSTPSPPRRYNAPACQISVQLASARLSCWRFNQFSCPDFHGRGQFCSLFFSQSWRWGSDLRQMREEIGQSMALPIQTVARTSVNRRRLLCNSGRRRQWTTDCEETRYYCKDWTAALCPVLQKCTVFWDISHVIPVTQMTVLLMYALFSDMC